MLELAIVRIIFCALCESVHGLLFRWRQPIFDLEFTPSPWARSGRSQTVLSCLSRGHKIPYTKKEFVTMEDNVKVLLEWKDTPQMAPNAPILVVVYGMGGDGDSVVAHVTTDECVSRGMRGVVYNRRGHGQSSLLPSRRCFRHADMDDIDCVVKHIHKTFPQAPMYAIGFSLGANVVVTYIGTQTDHPFRAAISMSNAYDLCKFVDTLSAETSAVLVGALRPVCKARAEEFDPSDRKTLMSTTCTMKFNEALLPLGSDVREHLRKSSCVQYLSSVNVPLLCMSAEDDHIIHPDLHNIIVDASKKNDKITILRTRHGGHLGWLTGWGGKRWWVDKVFDFILRA